MTAQLTPPTVDAFAAYYLGRGERWGIFCIVFEDHNYRIEPAVLRGVRLTDEERELVRLYAPLTHGQRRRLARKAEDKAGELKMVRLSRRALAHEARR